MPHTPEQRRVLGEASEQVVPEFAESGPAQEFRAIAASCEPAGTDAVAAQASLWRRTGGASYHLSPMAASAAMRFDAHPVAVHAADRADAARAGLT